MISNEDLERFLTESGITWEMISHDHHISLSKDWIALYGDCLDFDRRIRHKRHKEGTRAQEEYFCQSAEVFLIVPFLGDKGGPHSIGKRGPRTAAYECRGDGKLPDLSPHADIDFFIVPPNLSWTMIHTHEDYSLGGPYFIHRNWRVR